MVGVNCLRNNLLKICHIIAFTWNTSWIGTLLKDWSPIASNFQVILMYKVQTIISIAIIIIHEMTNSKCTWWTMIWFLSYHVLNICYTIVFLWLSMVLDSNSATSFVCLSICNAFYYFNIFSEPLVAERVKAVFHGFICHSWSNAEKEMQN